MRLLQTAAVAALFAFASPAAIAQNADMSAAEYVAMAASSDMFEIQSSQLALENAQSDELKEFAQEMVTDHGGTSAKLMAAAKQEQVSVPESMMEKHASMLQSLQNASGAEFDQAYMEAQLASHQEALALHSAYAENGDSEPLKAAAGRAVPIVQEHLEEVQQMTQSMQSN